jgi:16S rRNA G966 N2-methylase RsmD
MTQTVAAIVQEQHQELRELDRRVDEAEGEGLRARWEFGHALIRDKVNVDAYARNEGKPEKATEYHNRRRFAKKFKTEDEFLYALKEWPSWWQMLNKGLRSDSYGKNAAGAHEGTETSTGDAAGENWKLLLGDFRERLLGLPAGSVNAIITDPPYPEDYLPLWTDLGIHAARLLCDGGVLLARCGHLYLPQILNSVSESLQFGWVYSEPLPGSNVRFQGRKIAVSFQPWVAFSKGPWPSGSIEWHPDTLTESPRVKERYVWEQKWDVAAEVTATFTSPGHDVLDPFAGSGAYGVAALSVGCRWVGVEIDSTGHVKAAERLAAL